MHSIAKRVYTLTFWSGHITNDIFFVYIFFFLVSLKSEILSKILMLNKQCMFDIKLTI